MKVPWESSRRRHSRGRMHRVGIVALAGVAVVLSACGSAAVPRARAGAGRGDVRAVTFRSALVANTTLEVLGAAGVGSVPFGTSASRTQSRFDRMFGKAQAPYHRTAMQCGLNGYGTWNGLTAYFRKGHFVGYEYAYRLGHPTAHGRLLFATTKGLKIGDTLRRARRLYAPERVSTSLAQGGVWFLTTPTGKFEGYLADVTRPPIRPSARIASINAGRQSCPAVTP